MIPNRWRSLKTNLSVKGSHELTHSPFPKRSQSQALEVYEDKWPNRCYNFAQNPLKRPIVSAHPTGSKLPTMFCLIHSGGLIWLPSVNRFLASLELAVINGLDTRQARPSNGWADRQLHEHCSGWQYAVTLAICEIKGGRTARTADNLEGETNTQRVWRCEWKSSPKGSRSVGLLGRSKS